MERLQVHGALPLLVIADGCIFPSTTVRLPIKTKQKYILS
jgi:hypothetical protein